MNENIERAIYLLGLAADYLEETAPTQDITYEGFTGGSDMLVGDIRIVIHDLAQASD